MLFAESVVYRLGPRFHINTGGSLTISEATLVKTEDDYELCRFVGTFEATLYGTGFGLNPNNPVLVTGRFDVLLIN